MIPARIDLGSLPFHSYAHSIRMSNGPRGRQGFIGMQCVVYRMNI